DDAEGADLAVRLGHGDGDGLGMDIEAQVAQVAKHRPAPFACSSAWFGSSDRVTYACDREPVIPHGLATTGWSCNSWSGLALRQLLWPLEVAGLLRPIGGVE